MVTALSNLSKLYVNAEKSTILSPDNLVQSLQSKLKHQINWSMVYTQRTFLIILCRCKSFTNTRKATWCSGISYVTFRLPNTKNVSPVSRCNTPIVDNTKLIWKLVPIEWVMLLKKRRMWNWLKLVRSM